MKYFFSLILVLLSTLYQLSTMIATTANDFDTTANDLSVKLLTGSCVIFTGIRKMTLDEQLDEYYYEDYDGHDRWIVESDEQTKHRLLSGLLSLGIKCEMNDINIVWTNKTDATKLCKCKIDYPKVLKDKYLDIYIQGLSGFDFSPGPLEFTIEKIE